MDVQGVKALREARASEPAGVLNGARFVFVTAENIGKLEARLRGRGTETEEVIQRRIGVAEAEMAYGRTSGFDAVIVNVDGGLDESVRELSELLKSWYLS